ncbi:flagellar hook protein FliD [Pseudomonas sp. FFUP_PS_473]|uniref:flagellar filament capping protein FliD n=1 Tax=Pseudomonas TaxID=286 RepID=UPI000C7DB89D|nr:MULTISPECIES: flagellar filament capping protein FliD [Pseudomonas]MBM3109054.1 flagellar filament capping protein FliD [Pseudomonas arcuscaelestis]PLP93198.1 flagellar hook protein FliD [Pseudomonas sp. FFUP_PS_473]
MASPISASIGTGSGMDIGAIVKVLVDADTAAKASQIQRQTANNSAMISGVASLKSALSTYQAALNKLNDKDAPSFLAYAATSGNESAVGAKANNSAVPGSYLVEVDKLATSSRVASKKFSGSDAPISPGTLEITQNGKVHKVEIGADATLQSVRDSINSTLGKEGITANIISDGNGSRLVFGSTTTGKGSDISVGGIPELVIDNSVEMSGDAAGRVGALAIDAEVRIDGILVTSKSNQLDNTISGLSLDLKAEGSKTTVTVGVNHEGLKKDVQTFVDAYNAVVKTINDLTSTSKDADGNTVLGPLTGDPTARAVLASLRSELAVAQPGGGLTSLGQLGINTTKDGTLEFNDVKFTAALNDKKLGGEVQKLFTSDDGVIARMNKAMEPFLKSGGSLDSRNDALNRSQRQLASQQEALDYRIESLTTSLTKKYIAMDIAVGKLKSQADGITSMFDAMNAQAKNS